MIAPQGRIPNLWPMETSEIVIPVIGFYSHVPSSSLPLSSTPRATRLTTQSRMRMPIYLYTAIET